MTEYGEIKGNSLIVHKNYRDGLKPVISEPPEAQEGYVFIQTGFEETVDSIVLTWERRPVDPDYSPDATPEDYEAALRELGVNV